VLQRNGKEPRRALVQIGIIGAGSVGHALSEAFRRLGHDVVVGVRDPDDPRHADVVGRGTVGGAVSGSAVVLLAVPAPALPGLLPELPLAPPTVVVDATNAVGSAPPGGYATVGAYVRAVIDPAVPVVKAFNTIGAEHMSDGRVDGEPAFLPVAGDSAGADLVVGLARDIGFDAVWLGDADSVGMVEDHARLWIHLMRSRWGRAFGFGVLGRPGREEIRRW
jgi:8-hydroxy-5-deazaflavin:NADPH oxidoreductase